jgi:hypothetical protein
MAPLTTNADTHRYGAYLTGRDSVRSNTDMAFWRGLAWPGPSPGYLAVLPGQISFADDSAGNVGAARACGWNAVRYRLPGDLGALTI